MNPFAKPNKYKAKPTEYGGLKFASKAEAAYAERLDLLQRAGKVAWWLPQVKFRLGCPENTYTVDFLVAEPDGVCDGLLVHAVDVKGMETAKFRKDKRLWAAYGPMPLVIVKGKKIETINPGDEA